MRRTHKALASAIKIIARADDSSGIIGDACRRLITLHPTVAAAAGVAPRRLVDWMIKFQFDGDVDFFTLDVVAYAPALGETGVENYRARLAEIEAGTIVIMSWPPWRRGRMRRCCSCSSP